MNKTGILLVNLGTPDSPGVQNVKRYLDEFLMDKRVIDIPYLQRFLLVKGIIVPFRAKNSAKSYERIWTENGSPLKYYGEQVAEMLQQKMDAKKYVVQLAMRYRQPSIEFGLNKLKQAKVNEIIVFPLYPQYASSSTGTVNEEVMRIVSKWQSMPQINFISSYHDHPKMIDIFAKNGHALQQQEQYEHVLFSFHGLPERQLKKADDSQKYCLNAKNCCTTFSVANQHCYSAQCHQTAYKIAEKLNLQPENYSICFQSRLGKSPWKRPYTIDVIEELAQKGIKKVLVFCPAFVADCLETIFEIEIEYNEEFKKMGGEKLTLVPSLNRSPEWIDTIEEIILKNCS